LDQIEVPGPEDLHNACTDVTKAYMLFFERSGQFMNREAEFIHNTWGDTEAERNLALDMLRNENLDISNVDGIPEFLKSRSYLSEVVDRIGGSLDDDERTTIIEATRQRGYDQNARYLNCSCCGMGNFRSSFERFNCVDIPTIISNDSPLKLLVLSEEEVTNYLNHGDFKCIYNVVQQPFADSLYFFLIPNLCEVDCISLTLKATFCDHCYLNLWSQKKLPKLCVKSCDLMNFLAFPGIRQLTALEMLILSPIKLYGLKYMICENGNSSFSFSGQWECQCN
jgi:hypothetical protein